MQAKKRLANNRFQLMAIAAFDFIICNSVKLRESAGQLL